MTDTETHSSASVEKTGFHNGCVEDSIVAKELGLLMWSTNKIHKERLADQLSAMEQSPHDNPVPAAKGHMQHKWLKS